MTTKKLSFIALLLVGGALFNSPCIALTIDSSSTEWTPILYPNNNRPDPTADQQTGSKEADLVGDTDNPSFYTQFDDAGTPSLTDGTLAFRSRHGEENNPAGFSRALFVGIDANGDGALDAFVGVDNSGSNDLIGIWDPGTGGNTSPNTTSIVSPTAVPYVQDAVNYNWRAVDTALDTDVTTDDADATGEVDFFLSFSIPFADLVGFLAAKSIVIDQNTPLTYVMATATQDNSLNQDLNGVNGGISSALTWVQLGALTEQISAAGDQPASSNSVPAPGTLAIMGFGLVLLLLTGISPPRAKPQCVLPAAGGS